MSNTPQERDATFADLLNERQARVMRAVVGAYVGAAAPVGSKTVSNLLATRLSSASIRNTMSELAELGLIEKPHSSAGRVPTEAGLRLFVDHLLTPRDVAPEQQRRLRHDFEEADLDGAMRMVSQFLSENTQQLGFVMLPRLERVRLRYISLIRMSVDRVMVVLVTESGRAVHRVIEDRECGPQRELDRIAPLLNERIVGRTLAEVREQMAQEAMRLRTQAGSLLARAVFIGQRSLEAAPEIDEAGDLVVATRLALLEQPEFHDTARLRDLFAAMEDNEKLAAVLQNLLGAEGVQVSLGDQLAEPGLQHCALVSSPYALGSGALAGPGGLQVAGALPAPGGAMEAGGCDPLPGAQGLVGVIGPSRMDYPRVIPLVDLCSRLVAEKFNENSFLDA